MIKWKTYPAVSANRSFFGARQGDDILTVSYSNRLGRWTSSINHVFQASFSNSLQAKQSFKHHN